MGGPDSRGKREFDRQSGMVTSGVKAVDKREGSGSFNWGSDKDQIEDYQANEEPTAELDTSNENVEKVGIAKLFIFTILTIVFVLIKFTCKLL